MWLSMRVFIALCLVTLYCVEAQTELIFTPSNVQTRHVNVPQELIFVSSHNQPGTSKPENQGISQLLFTNSGQAKPYDESIFATATNFSPRQTHEDRPPVFASTPAQSLQRDLGVHLFASSAPGSSFSSSSYPTTTKAPYYDTTTYTPYFSNPTYPTYTTSAPSLGLGRSTIFSSSPSSPSSASFETNVKLPLGPPVFASNNVQSSSPSRTSTDFGTFAEGSLLNVSKGAEEFSLELLAKISNEHLSVPHRSYMVSPLSVWSLLVLLTEGAEGNTLTELRNTLRIQNDSPQSLRSAYRQINQRL
uniref:Serpin domain-containing protein n=1 Tax=Stomoxys calcitrans TaxID=35570 RepID=A0A1I8PPY9_STOCA